MWLSVAPIQACVTSVDSRLLKHKIQAQPAFNQPCLGVDFMVSLVAERVLITFGKALVLPDIHPLPMVSGTSSEPVFTPAVPGSRDPVAIYLIFGDHLVRPPKHPGWSRVLNELILCLQRTISHFCVLVELPPRVVIASPPPLVVCDPSPTTAQVVEKGVGESQGLVLKQHVLPSHVVDLVASQEPMLQPLDVVLAKQGAVVLIVSLFTRTIADEVDKYKS